MDLTEILREHNPNLKDITLERYSAKLEKIRKCVGGDKMYTFLKKPVKVLSCLAENDHTRKLELSIVMTMCKIIDLDDDILEVYRQELNSIVEKVKARYKSGEKSEKEKANWLTKADLEAIQQDEKEEYEKIITKTRGPSIKGHRYLDSQNYVLLSLYLSHPLRNDVAYTKIVNNPTDWEKMKKKDKEKGNYLILDRLNENVKLVMNEYKTDKYYGQKVINIDKEVGQLIMHFLRWRAYHGWESNYFLLNRKMEPMSENGITKSFNRLFDKYDKKISTSMLRHILLTDMFSEINEKKKEIADMIGNSPATIDNKYVKKD